MRLQDLALAGALLYLVVATMDPTTPPPPPRIPGDILPPAPRCPKNHLHAIRARPSDGAVWCFPCNTYFTRDAAGELREAGAA